MKKTLMTVVLLAGLISTAYAGSWLRHTYQGSFCDHGFRYNVDTDGVIRIEKLPPPCPNPCNAVNTSGALMTYYGSSFPNSIYVTYDDLPELIKNLTKIQADMKAADDEK